MYNTNPYLHLEPLARRLRGGSGCRFRVPSSESPSRHPTTGGTIIIGTRPARHTGVAHLRRMRIKSTNPARSIESTHFRSSSSSPPSPPSLGHPPRPHRLGVGKNELPEIPPASSLKREGETLGLLYDRQAQPDAGEN